MSPIKSQSLQINTNTDTIDSPGSSVFDLPIAQNQSIPRISAPDATQLAATSDDSSSYSYIVLSGGTGGNAICSAFGPDACYVLPVSDDGGSSSEIIRVLGGPSIGDIRSRLVRLIPPAPPSSPLDAIRTLLAYRLPSKCTEREARDEWRDIVEGRSGLWEGIPNDRKETIRGFLVYFESELLKRAHKNFTFLNGSIGNYFIAAAQGFFRSLPSAIFLFSSITNSQANILPVVVTNHTVTIATELENGGRLVGQCEISHPVASDALSTEVAEVDPWSPVEEHQSRRNVMFEQAEKQTYDVLPSRIKRLFYINAYGNEIHPSPNPDYIAALNSYKVLVYSCGSLWTSIIPNLALKGVAGAIARSSSLHAKVLLLNSSNDRETHGYSAVDYIHAIARTLNAQYSSSQYHGLGKPHTTHPVSTFITDIVYLRGTRVEVNIEVITALGIRCTEIVGDSTDADGCPRFDAECVKKALRDILSSKDSLLNEPVFPS